MKNFLFVILAMLFVSSMALAAPSPCFDNNPWTRGAVLFNGPIVEYFYFDANVEMRESEGFIPLWIESGVSTEKTETFILKALDSFEVYHPTLWVYEWGTKFNGDKLEGIWLKYRPKPKK